MCSWHGSWSCTGGGACCSARPAVRGLARRGRARASRPSASRSHRGAESVRACGVAGWWLMGCAAGTQLVYSLKYFHPKKGYARGTHATTGTTPGPYYPPKIRASFELADVSHGQLRRAPQQLSCTGPAAAAPPWRPHPARRRPRPQRGKAWRGAVAPTCAFRGWA